MGKTQAVPLFIEKGLWLSSQIQSFTHIVICKEIKSFYYLSVVLIQSKSSTSGTGEISGGTYKDVDHLRL